MNIKLLTLVLMVFCYVHTYAQQKPHYTQYIQNQYIINPALSGIEMYADVKLSHRHQWVGIDDGPITSYFSIQGPLGNVAEKDIPTTLRMPSSNSRDKEYWNNYKSSAAHHGWGLQLIRDRTGPLTHLGGQLTYAYHIPVNDVINFSAGVGVGASQLRLDPSKLRFATTVDPAVYTTNIINKIRPDISAGVYLYGPSLFAGISAQQLVPGKIEFADNITRTINGKAVPHLFGIVGYRTMIGDEINIIPSILLKYVKPAPIQPELNVKLQYLDVAWAGASYRYKDGVAAMVGFIIGNNANLSYSYDYTTSGLQTYSRGTHEVIIGFYIKNRRGDSCPRNVW
jgi:type IX secretion system PorP/SprF family membrane protein